MKKISLMSLSILWAGLSLNVWGGGHELQQPSPEYSALNAIIQAAEEKRSKANQRFVTQALLHQQKLLAFHTRINNLLIELYPSFPALRILNFAAFFHSGCKAALEELSLLGKPYVNMLAHLENTIKTNADLIKTIAQFDEKLSLKPTAPKQPLDISGPILKTCEDFFRELAEENIAFCAQRKADLEEYHNALTNFRSQHNLSASTETAIQTEQFLVSKEIISFTTLLDSVVMK